MSVFDSLLAFELFFAALFFGIIVSILISFVCSYYLQMEKYNLNIKWAEKEKDETEIRRNEYFKENIKYPFRICILILAIVITILYFGFSGTANITKELQKLSNLDENGTCISQNITNVENYYTLSPIVISPSNREMSVRELNYLLNKGVKPNKV